MKKIKILLSLTVFLQVAIPYFAFCQKKMCYVWVNGRWEGAKANLKYHPDSLRCISVNQPAANKNSITIKDHRDDNTVRNERLLITESETEKKYNIIGLKKMTAEEKQKWQLAVDDQLGIIGSDFRGVEEIGSAAFERANESPIGSPIDNFDFWYPQRPIKNIPNGIKFCKRTLIGKIDKNVKPEVQNIDDFYTDYDVNIHIKPNPKYMYLLDEAHKPEMSKKQGAKEVIENLLESGELSLNGCPEKFYTVEAEFDSKKYINEKIKNQMLNRIEKPIAVYGPWIWDEGHCFNPEIHPAEQIWWNESVGNEKIYYCNLICDDSKRFWFRDQMDDGTEIKPWAAPPIKGVFAIAFEVNIGNGITANSGTQKIFNLKTINNENVRDYSKTNGIVNNKAHKLIYNGKTVVIFTPQNNLFKVSFEGIGLVQGATANDDSYIKGFLVLETEVGSCTLVNKVVTYPNPLYMPTAPIQQPFVTEVVPDNANPNKVKKIVERQAFEKVAGHYLFTVNEITKANSLSVSQ